MANENCKSAVAKHIEKYEANRAEHLWKAADRIRRFKRVDTLVNNAAKQIKCTDMAEIDLENVESTFRSNILQMFAITKYCLPHMREGSR